MIKKAFIGLVFVGSSLFASVQNVANISDLKEAIVLLLQRQAEIDKQVKESIRGQKEFVSSAVSVIDSLEALGDRVLKIEESVKKLEGGEKVEDLRKDSEEVSEKLGEELQALKDNVQAVKDQMATLREITKESENQSTVFDKKSAELLFREIFNDQETYHKFEALFNKLFEIKAKENAFGVINQTIVRLDGGAEGEEVVTHRTLSKQEMEAEELKKQEQQKLREQEEQKRIEQSAPKITDEQFILIKEMVTQIAQDTARKVFSEITDNTKKLNPQEDEGADLRVLPISKSKWARGLVAELNQLKLELSRLKNLEPERLQWLEYKVETLQKALRQCCAKKSGVEESEVVFEYELK